MPMVRAMRLLNSIEAGITDGAELQTLLDDAGRKSDFDVLICMRGQARRMAASSTAMSAVAASSTAMSAVLASSTAMSAVAASSTAMSAVAASSTAMSAIAASSTAMSAVWASDTASDAVLTSSTSKLEIYNSDTALSALQANPTQVQRQIGISGRVTSTNTSSSYYQFVANGTKCILLRRYYSNDEADCLCWGRGQTTANSAGGVTAGGRNLYTNSQALGCTSGTYTSNGTMPTTNNETANFVAACNGLKRVTWVTGSSLNVYYILV